MKKIIVFLIIILAVGCDVQKSRYTGGYYIEWLSFNRTENRQTNVKPERQEKARTYEATEMSVRQEFLLSEEREPVTTQALDNRLSMSIPSFVEETTIVEEVVIETPENSKPEVISESEKVSETKHESRSAEMWFLATLLGSLLGLFGLRRYGHKTITSLTRWAKKNQILAMSALAVIQLAIIGLGAQLGYGMNQLGMHISTTTAVIASVLFGAGMLTVPFFPGKKKLFNLPNLNKHRLAYLLAGVSGFVGSAYLGSHVTDVFEGSQLHQTMEQVDHQVFGENPTPDSNRTAVAMAAITAGGILLLILSSILACAGVCALIFGVAMIVEGTVEGVLLLLGGALLLFIAVKGFQSALNS